MILDALARLEAAQHAFIAALDSSDLTALQAAAEETRAALADIRVDETLRSQPQVRDRARAVMALIEAAAMRVNFLTDSNTRRIHALAAATGADRVPAYTAAGRIAA